MSKKNNVVAADAVVEVAPVTHDINALLTQHKSKSAVIRHLDSLGLKRGEIVKIFTDGGQKMIYQHVRNVLITPIKKA